MGNIPANSSLVNGFRLQFDLRINLSLGLVVWDQRKIPWCKARRQYKFILYGQFCSKDIAVLTLKFQTFSWTRFQCIIYFPTCLNKKGLNTVLYASVLIWRNASKHPSLHFSAPSLDQICILSYLVAHRYNINGYWSMEKRYKNDYSC